MVPNPRRYTVYVNLSFLYKGSTSVLTMISNTGIQPGAIRNRVDTMIRGAVSMGLLRSTRRVLWKLVWLGVHFRHFSPRRADAAAPSPLGTPWPPPPAPLCQRGTPATKRPRGTAVPAARRASA